MKIINAFAIYTYIEFIRTEMIQFIRYYLLFCY